MQHQNRWEERWHPLRREWVIVAAHRQERPWIGEKAPAVETPPSYDPKCYLCPGNLRSSGERNPDYTETFAFTNDHPCVGPAAPDDPVLSQERNPRGLYRVRPAKGIARVVCYSPRHDLTLARLGTEEIVRLLRCWQDEFRTLGARPEVNHVLIFENNGAVVGVSNPHPHCQIYATNFVFKTILNEADYCREHFTETGRSLFGDVLETEQADGRRILAENGHAIAFLPWFARYAYEVYVAPARRVENLAQLEEGEELRGFAEILREMLIRFDNLWKIPFPYVMALHNAPTDGKEYPGFWFHIEFHPPLRKPNLKKYLAGPEIGGGSFLADTLPEEKAGELKAVSGTRHYLDGE